MTASLNIPASVLQNLYVDGEMSAVEVAEYLGVNSLTVYKYLRKYNMVRTAVDGTKMAFRKGKMKPYGGAGELKGPDSPNWKGGRHYIDGYVYVYAPGNPHASSGGHYMTRKGLREGLYAPEHILVWEKEHGCPVPSGYDIHHLNGIKDDNRPDNLVAIPHSVNSVPYSTTLNQLLQDRIRALEIRLGI